jgi:hypothetical protein
MFVKVWNDNVHPYSEKYMGKDVYIAPKAFIEMDHNEASHFLGTRPPNVEVDANGIQKPTSYKMLRIEKGNGSKTPTPKQEFRCMADGKVFHSQAELDAYIAENHVESMVDEKAKEKITKRRGRPPKGVKDDASAD